MPENSPDPPIRPLPARKTIASQAIAMIRLPMINFDDFDCQSCGACCSYSAEWPRFSTESDEELDLIPEQYVSADLGGMRCDGVRCSALAGRIGEHTTCTIYEIRPEICRACQPGDPECFIARAAHGMK